MQPFWRDMTPSAGLVGALCERAPAASGRLFFLLLEPKNFRQSKPDHLAGDKGIGMFFQAKFPLSGEVSIFNNTHKPLVLRSDQADRIGSHDFLPVVWGGSFSRLSAIAPCSMATDKEIIIGAICQVDYHMLMPWLQFAFQRPCPCSRRTFSHGMVVFMPRALARGMSN
jgi:hypothetical protein